jgi:hypothetical protein
MVYHGLTSICQLEVHRCLTTSRVFFIWRGVPNKGRGSSSDGNTDASVVNIASSVCELGYFDGEQCEFGL